MEAGIAVEFGVRPSHHLPKMPMHQFFYYDLLAELASHDRRAALLEKQECPEPGPNPRNKQTEQQEVSFVVMFSCL
jgi:hypothetical protein